MGDEKDDEKRAALDDAFFKRKEAAVLKDLDTAFAGYQRLVTQVNSVRNWTVTLMAASIGIVLTKNTASPFAVLATAATALFAFALLELRERSSMAFNKSEVLNIERIMMVRDQDEYRRLIADYEFRDLRLGRIMRSEKIRHLVGSARNWQIILWYGFWIVGLGLAVGSNLLSTPRPLDLSV